MSETLETPPSDTMEIEIPQADDTSAANGAGSKRIRDEVADEGADEEADEEAEAAKKIKAAEKSVEEERLQNLEEKDSIEATLGPKSFGSGVEMFEYFVKFLRFWSPNVNINKYEHMVLLDLLKKGHLEPDQKLGVGVRAFQVRYHPQYKSRCFFLIREDNSVDDFSFRKCVNHILPLPENMQLNNDDNKGFSSGGKGNSRGRGGGRGRGRGRGGKPRN